jgi:hypothetical protein
VSVSELSASHPFATAQTNGRAQIGPRRKLGTHACPVVVRRRRRQQWIACVQCDYKRPTYAALMSALARAFVNLKSFYVETNMRRHCDEFSRRRRSSVRRARSKTLSLRPIMITKKIVYANQTCRLKLSNQRTQAHCCTAAQVVAISKRGFTRLTTNSSYKNTVRGG